MAQGTTREFGKREREKGGSEGFFFFFGSFPAARKRATRVSAWRRDTFGAMAAINITNVQVLDNPTKFTNPFQFEIEYECLYDLKDDLEWKLIYVGSAESEKHDQVLDSVLVGPVYSGGYRFVFQANPPDVSRLPTEDVVGVTVVFLSCSYNGEEFIRVGYYVNNEYDEEDLRENPPATPQIERLVRNILADKPRVTKWSINFDSNPNGAPMQVSFGLPRVDPPGKALVSAALPPPAV